MKKKVICILCFALFLLTACTMTSSKIEQEMLTQVVANVVEQKQAGKYDIHLPFEYLYFEDKFVDVYHINMLTDFTGCELFQVKEGTGWADGLRLQLVQEDEYMPDPVAGALAGFDETRGWVFVHYASRFPREGQKVEILESRDKAQERYLMIYPEQVPDVVWKLNDKVIAAQGSNALLLDVDNAPQPFIRDRAEKQFRELITPGCQIYSIKTVEEFWRNLPLVVGVAVLFIAAAVLWIQSMFLLKNDWENRWLLTANFLAGLGLLWGLWYLLGKIDLPSDLLPAENIFQWSHYNQEFTQILSALSEIRGSLFDSMKSLGRTGQLTVNLVFHTKILIKRIIVMSVCLSALWVSAPVIVRKMYACRKEENGGSERNIM